MYTEQWVFVINTADPTRSGRGGGLLWPMAAERNEGNSKLLRSACVGLRPRVFAYSAYSRRVRSKAHSSATGRAAQAGCGHYWSHIASGYKTRSVEDTPPPPPLAEEEARTDWGP